MKSSLALSCALFLAACGTAGPQEEAASTPPEMAMLTWSGGVRIKSLDGKLLGSGSAAELAPGEHQVNVAHSSNFGLTTYSATLAFEVEAGRRYEIQADCAGLVRCKPFEVWIVDLEDGTKIAAFRSGHAQ
jgi:hypothetical protein